MPRFYALYSKEGSGVFPTRLDRRERIMQLYRRRDELRDRFAIHKCNFGRREDAQKWIKMQEEAGRPRQPTDPLYVYTDGSLADDKSAASFAVWVAHDHPANLSGACPPPASIGETKGKLGSAYAERYAMLRALQQIIRHFELFQQAREVVVRTDCEPLVKFVTTDIKFFNTRPEYPFEQLMLDVVDLIRFARDSFGVRVRLEWVKGHAHVEGNERADRMARAVHAPRTKRKSNQ